MAAGEAGSLLCDSEGSGKASKSAEQEIVFSSVSGDQQGTSSSVKEKKSESCGEAATYIARWLYNSGRLRSHRFMKHRCQAIGWAVMPRHELMAMQLHSMIE